MTLRWLIHKEKEIDLYVKLKSEECLQVLLRQQPLDMPIRKWCPNA